MNTQKIYNELYQQWTNEINNEEITSLTNESFKEYLKLYALDSASDGKLNNSDMQVIKESLIDSLIKNTKFLLDDLLKVRKRKIIDKSLILLEIDRNKLLEHEQMFYDNLIASFKGFKNLESLTLSDIESSLKKKELTPVEKNVSEIPNILSKKDELAVNSTIYASLNGIEYLNVRFIMDCPALVGIDLVNYGPFLKEDVCMVPFENAKILIEEKIAEKIMPK